MPRALISPELKRTEYIAALFTKIEKERVRAAARNAGLPVSIFIYRTVIARLEAP